MKERFSELFSDATAGGKIVTAGIREAFSGSCGALQGVLKSLQGSLAKAKWHKQQDNWHFCTVNTLLIKGKGSLSAQVCFTIHTFQTPLKSFYRMLKNPSVGREKKVQSPSETETFRLMRSDIIFIHQLRC